MSTGNSEVTGSTLRGRIASLDEFRGYTVVGMLLVNFIGDYKITVPAVLRHHNTYCSYADTIMPQFFFAVGFAYRLTLLRRLETLSSWDAYSAVFRRNLGLILLGFVIYHLDGKVGSWQELQNLGWSGFFAQAFRRDLFQTLVHIAVTAIWIMPVIAARPGTRIIFMLASGALHLLFSRLFYFDWAWKVPVIDGGAMGFMSWAIPMLAGSLAYDLVTESTKGAIPRLLAWAIGLMAIGYLITGGDGQLDLPPFVKPGADYVVNMWTMSQRTGSVSYLTFSAGFSVLVYALFVALCDIGTLRVGLFQTFGQNALAAYILHPMVASAIKPYLPPDVPAWVLTIGFLAYFGLCYLFIRHLEKHRLFLKL
ncbi:MAG: hypothetical protein ABS79_07515 [Planctomycetes bacterium SCN 63-9]|nr:MAG: hypothetical protein ABS79_07515 [Planctomycetes bacterium SCN 63-9]